MTGMDMDRFEKSQEQAASNSGFEFADVPKLTIDNGVMGRIIGDFHSVFEHFINLPQGARPYYCEGPESGCPICNIATQFAISDNPAHQELSKSIKAKEKFYFNVLDRSPVGRQWHQVQKKSKILAQTAKANNVGVMVFQAIGAVVKMRKQTGQNHDPNTFDIMFTKQGTGMQTKYGAQFTGVQDPLTEEEKQYELWPLKEIGKITSHAERETVADLIYKGGVVSQDQQNQQNVSVNSGHASASGPVQMSRRLAGPTPVSTPANMQRQAASQHTNANQAVDQPPFATGQSQSQPAKLQLNTPPKQSNYQMTHKRQSTNDLVDVPCTACGVVLYIDMEDVRELKCHGCGKIFDHPSKA